MARIFVSFASEDLAQAVAFTERLRAAGHEVFLDRDRAGIRAGEDWRDRLLAELRAVDAVVALVSPDSIASAWCSAEITHAQVLGRTVIPVRVAGTGLHPLLELIQHRDLAALSPDLAELAVPATGSAPWNTGGNPFPGLEPFTAAWAGVFHGRESETRDLLGLLRGPGRLDGGVLAIVGPSGCGKSSLLRAGLLPALAGDSAWLGLPVWVPGRDPVGSLARVLAAAGARGTTAELRERLAAGGLAAIATELLDADPAAGRDRVLLAVDQAEEIFSRASAEQRALVGQVLGATDGSVVSAVLTLRSEFLDDLTVLPTLAGRLPVPYPLGPMGPDRLATVVERPAAAAGLTLEEGLAARLVEDTGTGEALPLLAFTLHELAEGVPAGGRLTLERYDLLGGVAGALSRHADQALATAAVRSRLPAAEVVTGLVRLVTVDGAGRRARRRLRAGQLPERLRPAFDVLVEARLLVTDTDEDGRWLGVAHEKLLTAWAPLDEAVTGLAVALATARGIEQAAQDWRSAGEPLHHLWDHERVTAARTILTGGGPEQLVPLDEEATAFLAASDAQHLERSRRELRRRRFTTVGLSAFLVLAIAVAGMAFWLLESAREGARAASARDMLSQATALFASDPVTAFRLTVASQQLEPTTAAENLLVAQLGGNLLTSAIPAGVGPVRAVAYRPDGKVLATGGSDRLITVWDMSDRERPVQIGGPLRGARAEILALAWSPDGRYLVTASGDATAQLWDLADPAQPRPAGVLAAQSAVFAVTWAGSVVLTGGLDGTVRLWDVADPARPRQQGEPLVHGAPIASAVLVGDRVLVVGTGTGQLWVWDLTDPGRPVPAPLQAPGVGNTLVVAADPARPGVVAVAGDLGGVVLWDVSDPRAPRALGTPVQSGTGQITRLLFFPKGANGVIQLLSTGADRSVHVWDTTNGAAPVLQPGAFVGHTGIVAALALSPDGGQSLVTGGGDGRVLVWTTGARPRTTDLYTVTGRSAPSGTNFSTQWVAAAPRLGLAAGGDLGGRIVLRRIGTSGFTGVAQEVTGPGTQAGALSDAAGLLAVGDATGGVRLWDIRGGALGAPADLGRPHSKAVRAMVFSADGRLLVTAGEDRAVLRWDVSDPVHPRRLGAPLAIGVAGPVTALALTADARTLYVAGDGGALSVWDLTDPAVPRAAGNLAQEHTDLVSRIVLSADGRTMATVGSDYRTVLWDVADPGAPRMLGEPLTGQHLSPVTGVALAPDGSWMVTSGADGVFVLWDVRDPARPVVVGTLPGVLLRGSTAVASAGGDLLVSGLPDGALQLMDLSPLARLRGTAVGEACARAAGGLTEGEWRRFAPDLDFEDACAGRTG